MLPALKRLYRENGTLGVLEWIYDKKRFIVVKAVLKTTFLIFPYETLLKQTAKYNKNIPEFGFTESTKKFLDRLNIKIKFTNTDKLTGPCLIFGNHPTGLDPFIISACLKRDDVFIVADVYQKNKGNNIGDHIVPIYYSRTQKNLRNRGFLNSIGFYVMRIFTGYEDQLKVKQRNQTTIELATSLLQQGHIVIIFPDGGSNNPELWYNGIGEIIKRNSLNQNEIKLFATQIQGISTLKLIRHFLFNRRKYLHHNPATVILSEPLSLETLKLSTENQSQEITERLRTEFAANKLWAQNYVYSG
jgi:1-acyl-sn-glycerol-3-phosphate acyltransferase